MFNLTYIIRDIKSKSDKTLLRVSMRAVLGSQQNREEGTEISQTPSASIHA